VIVCFTPFFIYILAREVIVDEMMVLHHFCKFPAISWENKIYSRDDYVVCFVLSQHA